MAIVSRVEQYPGDQKARQHEEKVNAHPTPFADHVDDIEHASTMGASTKMVHEHHRHGHRADSVKRRKTILEVDRREVGYFFRHDLSVRVSGWRYQQKLKRQRRM